MGVELATLSSYFSVFKLLFTLRAIDNAVAPESPILFLSRLWKRILKSYIVQAEYGVMHTST